MDVSGLVAAVGAGVTRFTVGDPVFGAAAGAFAEFVCAPEDRLCLKPARLCFEPAAATARNARAGVGPGTWQARAAGCRVSDGSTGRDFPCLRQGHAAVEGSRAAAARQGPLRVAAH